MKKPLNQIALAAMFFLTLPAQAGDLLGDLYGTWKIQTVLGGGAVGSLSDHEARQLIGKTFRLEARRFTFDGKPCTATHYEETTEDTTGHFEREWNTGVKDIPLPDPVTVIDTGCNTLYRLRNGKLMVAEKGVFFEAARTKRSGSH